MAMTTIDVTMPTRARNVLFSEWIKIRSVRSSYLVLLFGAAAAVGIGDVARESAPDLDPLRALAGEPHADAVVDFEIVGQHQRAGAVDDIGEADGVAEHLLRRALEPEVISIHHGAVHRDRLHYAKLLELAHEG